MLTVNNISKKINNKQILKNITFNVKKGEILGLLGPNGAGKTTTLKTIIGNLKPEIGYIEFEGNKINDSIIYYKKNIAFVPDSLNIYENLTGKEYISFIAELWDIPSNIYKKEMEYLSKKFFLNEKLDDFIRTYSKGMKQKTILIGALIHNPKLLILDEPFNGLDPISIKIIKEYFAEYTKKGNSIIFSSHILDVVEKICTNYLIINQGTSIAKGSVSNLKEIAKSNSQDLETIFYELIHNLKEVK
ncbi:ABC transporter ATP-binding protein [Acetobacter persici]|uniref:ABC transporter ATP-binding protein n=1 Tax=Acetobacter persici TaxID=1076596 RepID=UPI0036D7CC6F